MLEELASSAFSELVLMAFRYCGAFIRWRFLFKRQTFQETIRQRWNVRVGLITIGITSLALIYSLY